MQTAPSQSVQNRSMPKRPLTIHQQAGTFFATCEACNARFESKLLNESKAKEEIQAQYREHRCKRLNNEQNASATTQTPTDSERS